MISQLVTPPRLRLPNQESDRQATWLELFYDLVFSVAVSSIGIRLFAQQSAIGLLQAVVLFLPIWWAWVGHTIYNTRFDTDDLFNRLCTFGIMLGAAGMAISVPYVFEGGAGAFASAYIVARLFLFIMYVRAYRHVPEARQIIKLYLYGLGLGDSLWLISIFVPAPWSYLLWLVGVIISFSTPWIGIARLRQAPVDTSHVPVRFASFTIILLGEIIAVTVGKALGQPLESSATFAALLSFGIAACVWWLYFIFLDVAPVKNTLGPGQPFIYVHLPLVLGLLILSIGLEQAVAEAGRPLLSVSTRWLLTLGMSLWLFAGLTLKLVVVRRLFLERTLIRLGFLAILILLFEVVAGVYPPLLILGIFLGSTILYSTHEGFLLIWEARHKHEAGESRESRESGESGPQAAQ